MGRCWLGHNSPLEKRFPDSFPRLINRILTFALPFISACSAWNMQPGSIWCVRCTFLLLQIASARLALRNVALHCWAWLRFMLVLWGVHVANRWWHCSSFLPRHITAYSIPQPFPICCSFPPFKLSLQWFRLEFSAFDPTALCLTSTLCFMSPQPHTCMLGTCISTFSQDVLKRYSTQKWYLCIKH